ncbi:MAG: ATP-binding cassette domain-containing protein [Streptosporangiales bacterium]|nr:ATP-binding cassette domain-containing protein [Streptosporangiales bacterium]
MPSRRPTPGTRAEVAELTVAEPIVALEHVTKRFVGVTALADVSIEVHTGEVHVLLGENGAGKSTLVNTLIGTLQPDEGTVRLRGDEVRRLHAAQARRAGINAVLQDFSLAPTMTVAENLFLGREIRRGGVLRRGEMRRTAVERLAMIDADIDPTAEVGTLPRAEQQLVEIVKAMVGTPGVLLLDEPTAAISDSEAERLFAIVDRVKAEGWAVLYITHRMEEVRRLGDRVTVLRDGRHISTYDLDAVEDAQLIKDMVGRDLAMVFPAKCQAPGDTLLGLEHVSGADGKVVDVSLHVRAGEVVGVAGLVGCGKSELAKLVIGLAPTTAGTYEVCGKRISKPDPRTMLDAGIGYMPEDRKRDALALGRNVEENVTLEVMGSRAFSPLGVTRSARLRALANRLVEQVDVRPRTVTSEVTALSGGNQQKVVLARALSRDRKVFVVAEPTSGVDVGARQEIHAHLRSLCDDGAGVLLVSSDLEEVVGVSDRVYVMHSSRVQVELVGDQVTDEAVVSGAFGSPVQPGKED